MRSLTSSALGAHGHPICGYSETACLELSAVLLLALPVRFLVVEGLVLDVGRNWPCSESVTGHCVESVPSTITSVSRLLSNNVIVGEMSVYLSQDVRVKSSLVLQSPTCLPLHPVCSDT